MRMEVIPSKYGISTMFHMNDTNENPGFQPVLQVISLKPIRIRDGAGVQRYNAVLSGRVHFIQGLLTRPLSRLVERQELERNALISVQDFMNNRIQGRNVIVLMKIKVLTNPGYRLGCPTDIGKAVIYDF